MLITFFHFFSSKTYMNLFKILATYVILHITYTDLGLEIGDKFKKLVQSLWVIYPLMIATAYNEFDGDLESALLLVCIFYVLVLWGRGILDLGPIGQLLERLSAL